jgi:hypothetical protein
MTLTKTKPRETDPDQRVDDVIGWLSEEGVKLAVESREDGSAKLVQVMGQLNDIQRARVNRVRGLLVDHLLTVQSQRAIELEERIKHWRGQATADKGYEWSTMPSNWLTEFESGRFDDACQMFIYGEIELSAVHTAFVRYARAHKRRYMTTMRVTPVTRSYSRREVPFEDIVKSTDDENPGVQRVRCPVPQWEPTSTFAEEMFTFFGLTPEQVADYGNKR